MFESLTDKLQGAFKKFGSPGLVTEEDLDQALREVRMAMLEADVNFKVVREFTSRGQREGAWRARCCAA